MQLCKDTDFSGCELVSEEVQVLLQRLQVSRGRAEILLQQCLSFIYVILQHYIGLFQEEITNEEPWWPATTITCFKCY